MPRNVQDSWYPCWYLALLRHPNFRPDLSAATKQKIEKQIFESKEAQKLFEKKELKPLEKNAKGALKGLLGN